MAVQEEVIKLSDEMKNSKREKKKQINNEKNEALIPNNSISDRIFIQFAQTKNYSVNIDNRDIPVVIQTPVR